MPMFQTAVAALSGVRTDVMMMGGSDRRDRWLRQTDGKPADDGHRILNTERMVAEDLPTLLHHTLPPTSMT